MPSLPPKPLKFGQVEWRPYEQIDDSHRCVDVESGCERECSQQWEARALLDPYHDGFDVTHDEAAKYEFGVSLIDGSIVMARKLKGTR